MRKKADFLNGALMEHWGRTGTRFAICIVCYVSPFLLNREHNTLQSCFSYEINNDVT